MNELQKQKNVIIKRINDWLECYQNKDDGYYNATQLLRDYNEHYPNEQKLMKDFFKIEKVQRFIEKVEKTQLIDNHHKDNSPDGDNQQVTKSYYFKKGRTTKYGRTPDTYYFHSALFLKFGAWLNTDLEYDIYVVISNLVLEYRNDVTKLMPELKEAIKDFKCDGNIYIKLHSMLQCAIFGKYQPNQQPLDKADENQLFRYKQCCKNKSQKYNNYYWEKVVLPS